jgi:hypothetical protein
VGVPGHVDLFVKRLSYPKTVTTDVGPVDLRDSITPHVIVCLGHAAAEQPPPMAAGTTQASGTAQTGFSYTAT